MMSDLVDPHHDHKTPPFVESLDHFSRSAPVTVDAVLLKDVGAGDAKAFSQLFDAAAQVLFNLIHRILGNDDEAVGLLLEVLLECRATAADYDPSLIEPIPWLLTMARKKAIARLRISGVRQKAALVGQAIADMPPVQQEALELAFYEGLTLGEISERLNIPPGITKSRIAEAMEKLRTGQ